MVAAYERDPDSAPDELFEPGRLDHLVAGTSCRLLDARRTPLRVLAVRPGVGFFDVEVLAFEDRGATWELPLEWVYRLQFPLDGATASPADVERLHEALQRFDESVDLEIDAASRESTMRRLADERAQANAWLDSAASPWGSRMRHLDPDAPTGDPTLIADLDAYLDSRRLADLDRRFASGYVSNPSSGDLVKAHAIVAAELGLAPYHGPILRTRMRSAATSALIDARRTSWPGSATSPRRSGRRDTSTSSCTAGCRSSTVWTGAGRERSSPRRSPSRSPRHSRRWGPTGQRAYSCTSGSPSTDSS